MISSRTKSIQREPSYIENGATNALTGKVGSSTKMSGYPGQKVPGRLATDLAGNSSNCKLCLLSAGCYFTTVLKRPSTTGSRSFCSQSVSSTMRLKSVTRV